jgi:excisionase family DNA binding protein
MAAYATAERQAQSQAFRLVLTDVAQAPKAPVQGGTGFDVLLNELVELLAERVAARLAAPTPAGDAWLDTRGAAEYLGLHRDTVRRLAAEPTVPSEQEGPGCKLFCRRSDLDAWRCGARGSLRIVSGTRA